MATKEAHDLVDQYMHHRKRHTEATKETMNKIRHVLTHWLGEDVDHLDPTDEDMLEFAYRKTKNGEPAKNTVRNQLNNLRAFYDWAYRYNKLEVDYGLRLRDSIPKVDSRLQRRIPLAEFYDLDHLYYREETTLAVGLAWFAGLRVGEIARLKTENVRGDRLDVHRKRTKRGERFQPLPWRTMGKFLATQHEAEGFNALEVFQLYEAAMDRSKYRVGYLLTAGMNGGDATDPQRIRKWFYNPVEYVADKRNWSSLPFSPHPLRHSFAHNMYQAGVPIEQVAELLAHVDSNMTTSYYVDVTEGIEEDLLGRMSA